MRAILKAFLHRAGLYRPVRWTVLRGNMAFWRLVGLITKRDRRLLINYLSSHAVHKLHIGCGGNYLEGWFNTDINPNHRRARLDATATFPYADGMFDFIYSEHMIEHIPYDRGRAMLAECFRVLRPGGVLRIVTPDFKFLTDLYHDSEKKLHSDYIAWNSELFIGTTAPHCALSVINNYVRDWGHQFIYDKPLLRTTLETIGFMDITEAEIGKSTNPEIAGLEHEERMPDGFLALESLVLETRKPA